MKRLILISLMTTVLVVASSECRAEPTPAVNYLMNTPVSMFDFGISHLEAKLNDTLRSNGYKGLASVVYQWNTNKISINLFPTVQGKKYTLTPSPGVFLDFEPLNLTNEKEAKEQCKYFVAIVRDHLGINTRTGKPLATEKEPLSLLQLYFSRAHAGYIHKAEPKNLFGEIDNITEISVSIGYHVSEIDRKLVHARAPLHGTEVLFVDK